MRFPEISGVVERDPVAQSRMTRRYEVAKSRRHQRLGVPQRVVVGLGVRALAGNIGPARQRQTGRGGKSIHWRNATTKSSGGSVLRAFMQNQNAFNEFRNRTERRLRSFAMRRMSGARNDRHIDRTIALFLSDLDLSNCPI